MGYYKFPNGLIMQWGYIMPALHGQNKIIYPKPFPHATSIALCTTIRPDNGDGGYNHVWNVSRTGFIAVIDTDVEEGFKGGYWFALGY